MIMRLSIIIVSWNVKLDLYRSLQSIGKNSTGLECEIIVVDNDSTDGTVGFIKRELPHVKMIANSDNRGFSAANNQAIKNAKGEYLLILNPDTVVHPGSLDTLISFMDNHPDVGACGPKILDAHGTTHNSVGYVPTFRSVLHVKTIFRSLGIFRAHYRRLQTDTIDFDKCRDVEQLSGSALMVRRAVMEEIGLMDESFFLYYEDVDLCLRIRKAGWRIVYIPEALITHKGGRSTVQVSAKKKILLYRSLFIYLRKHKGRVSTGIFGLIFKPGLMMKNIINVSSGIISYMISVLVSDQKRRLKSKAKIRETALFLGKYSLYLIFRV